MRKLDIEIQEKSEEREEGERGWLVCQPLRAVASILYIIVDARPVESRTTQSPNPEHEYSESV